MKLLHKIVFWTHLIAGVSAGLIIFSMSFTGVVLMYEPQISDYSEHSVRWVMPSPDAKRLSYDELIAKVRASQSRSRPAMIMVKSDPPSFGGGQSRPGQYRIRKSIQWRDSRRTVADAQFPARHRRLAPLARHRRRRPRHGSRHHRRMQSGIFLARSHRRLSLVAAELAMARDSRTVFLFNPRLRGKARDWNWHNVIGFWSSSVLVVLTLTAAVMSYPWANDLLYTLTGSEPPRRRGSQRGAGPRRSLRWRASIALLARAQEQVPGWVMIMLRFPPRGDGPVTASIQGPDAFHPFQRSQLTLNRATGEVIKWEPYADNSTGRKLRTWVRALHTGEAFGLPGQTVAGLASLGGCFLVWTGLAMAWRRFRSWRRAPKISC